MTEAQPNMQYISDCADVLSKGGIAVFPTETVYGVGANVFDPSAIERLYTAKCRPREKALLCHLFSVEQAEEIGYLDDTARALLKAFTPGPLTVIVKKRSCIGDNVTSGMDTVGLRFPSNNVFLALAKRCGFPIAATSANISGEVSPAEAKAAIQSLGDRVDAVIDSGVTSVGVPSTIISLVENKPVILRKGAVTEEMINEVIGIW
ncbi:MAG: threonylcarbamoyl-AMP synthase [Clostridia bacterium]|jgi:L-threonylcarbamoyladenylate synthase|nr:threonylcarbamoyl-AMP synthase [Clostridia bacterium]